jgi:hypothetical protein
MRLTGLVSKRTFGSNKVTEAVDAKVQATADKIAQLTDDNNHTEAVVELAKFVANKKYVTILAAITTISKLEGDIPLQLVMYRSEIRRELLKQVQSKYGKEAVELISKAY